MLQVSTNHSLFLNFSYAFMFFFCLGKDTPELNSLSVGLGSNTTPNFKDMIGD